MQLEIETKGETNKREQKIDEMKMKNSYYSRMAFIWGDKTK